MPAPIALECPSPRRMNPRLEMPEARPGSLTLAVRSFDPHHAHPPPPPDPADSRQSAQADFVWLLRRIHSLCRGGRASSARWRQLTVPRCTPPCRPAVHFPDEAVLAIHVRVAAPRVLLRQRPFQLAVPLGVVGM